MSGGRVNKPVGDYMTVLQRLSALCVVLVIIFGANGLAVAAASDWFEHEQGAVRLISAGATAGSGEKIALGLEFRMKPGWKIYWRTPGDAGFPPQMNWAGSQNFGGAKMAWPAPHRFSVLDMETLGYQEQVVFPIEAQPSKPGEGVNLRAKVTFLTCDDICVPHETTLALDLPAGPDINTPEASAIETWRARVPPTGRDAPLAIEKAELAGEGASATLVVRISGKGRWRPDVFVEGPWITVSGTGDNQSRRRERRRFSASVFLRPKPDPRLPEKPCA